MTWTTPIIIEICIGLEINDYLPAEFRAGLIALTGNADGVR